MENWFLLYLLTRLDIFKELFIGVNVFSLLFMLGGWAGYLLWKGADPRYWEDEKKQWLPLFSKMKTYATTIFCVTILLSVSTPSKNDVFFIVGGSALLEAAKSERAGRIGNKTLDAVENWLDENMKKEKTQ